MFLLSCTLHILIKKEELEKQKQLEQQKDILIMNISPEHIENFTDPRAFLLLYHPADETILNSIENRSDIYEEKGRYKILMLNCAKYESYCESKNVKSDEPSLYYMYRGRLIDFKAYIERQGEALTFDQNQVAMFINRFSRDALLHFPSHAAMEEAFEELNISNYFVLEGKIDIMAELSFELYKADLMMVHFPSPENLSLHAIRGGIRVNYTGEIQPTSDALNLFIFRNQYAIFPKIEQQYFNYLLQGTEASAIFVVDLKDKESKEFGKKVKQYITEQIRNGTQLESFYRFAWCNIKQCPKYKKNSLIIGQLVKQEVVEKIFEVHDTGKVDIALNQVMSEILVQNKSGSSEEGQNHAKNSMDDSQKDEF